LLYKYTLVLFYLSLSYYAFVTSAYLSTNSPTKNALLFQPVQFVRKKCFLAEPVKNMSNNTKKHYLH